LPSHGLILKGTISTRSHALITQTPLRHSQFVTPGHHSLQEQKVGLGASVAQGRGFEGPETITVMGGSAGLKQAGGRAGKKAWPPFPCAFPLFPAPPVAGDPEARPVSTWNLFECVFFLTRSEPTVRHHPPGWPLAKENMRLSPEAPGIHSGTELFSVANKSRSRPRFGSRQRAMFRPSGPGYFQTSTLFWLRPTPNRPLTSDPPNNTQANFRGPQKKSRADLA